MPQRATDRIHRAMSIDLSGYVDVAERIRLFFERWPDGSIQASTPMPCIIGDRTFLQVTATVYRNQDDHRPSIATAWEPFPGTTPYTRNSEAMNCETSAAGRALAFLGFGIRRTVASADEINNRTEGPELDEFDMTFLRIKSVEPATKVTLQQFATTHSKKLTANAMRADPDWHAMVIETINACE